MGHFLNDFLIRLVGLAGGLSLLLGGGACRGGPRGTGGDAAATARPCEVAPVWSIDGDSGEARLSLRFGGRDAVMEEIVADEWNRPEVRVAPLGDGTALVAIDGEPWEVPEADTLWRAYCDASPPRLEVAMRRPGAWFATGVWRAADGLYYFTDEQGVAGYRPKDGQVVQITRAPEPTRDFVDGCTSVERMMRPRRPGPSLPPGVDDVGGGGGDAAGVDYRDWLVGAAPEGDGLLFRRGAWCESGIGPELYAETWLVEHPADEQRRSLRRPHPVASVAVDAGGALWLADAGECGRFDEETPGAVWLSNDGGERWERVEVRALGQLVLVDGMPERADVAMGPPADAVWADAKRPGVVLVHSQACMDLSGQVVGGALWLTEDGGATWRWLQAPARTNGAMEGMPGHDGIWRVDVDVGDVTRIVVYIMDVGDWADVENPGAGWIEPWTAFETKDAGKSWSTGRDGETKHAGEPPRESGFLKVGRPEAPREAVRSGVKYRATWDGLWVAGRRVFPAGK